MSLCPLACLRIEKALSQEQLEDQLVRIAVIRVAVYEMKLYTNARYNEAFARMLASKRSLRAFLPSRSIAFF